MKSVIYPGIFDPITNKNMDIIVRACAMFDKVILAVLEKSKKIPKYEIDERKEMLALATKEFENIEIDSFDCLLVDFARQKQTNLVIKELNSIYEFETKMQKSMIDLKLAPEIETVFMVSDYQFTCMTSNIVEEINEFEGEIEDLVPEPILNYIQKPKVKC